jgi:hypothetical protein
MNREYTLNNLLPYDESEFNGLKIIQKRKFNNDTQRIEKEILIIKEGVQKGYLESVRLYSLQELRNMFETNGFNIYREFGDYDGAELGCDSPRAIIIGIKQ